MGHEIAGTVVHCGALVRRFNEGDRVALMQRIPCGVCPTCRSAHENLCVAGPGFYGESLSGGYGDFVVASERNAVLIPPSVPAEVAAVMSCAIGTGLHALQRANVSLGDTVVITGAGGGVGIHAVQLARLMGLNTIAVTRSSDKRSQLLAAGADEVVISRESGFHDEVRALTDGSGADAVIEITGGPTFKSSARSVRAGGRLVLVGNVTPCTLELNPARSILKEIDVLGSGHATLADLHKVLDLVASGAITPKIAACLPRDNAANAHRRMEQHRELGRVVLVH
jgi:D-arabinose 1-dehydrogenase-like Zn-dependent alcohol dehydrogenase